MFQLRQFIFFCFLTTPFCYVQTQVANLAFAKKSISTVYEELLPSLAVDGKVNQTLKFCAHTSVKPKQTVAWWQVDLAEPSEIRYITIYYRKITVRRFNGFEIVVGMDDEWQNKTTCFSDTEPGYPPDIVTIYNCTGPGRYVTVFNYQYDHQDASYGPILELCEVQVYGCIPNRYGDECQLYCHCKLKGCFSENGTCFALGCEDGWQGTGCNIACDSSTFGGDCSLICHCQKGSCNPVTGVCDVPGCKAGWTGASCSTPCVENNYGSDCNFRCHCQEGSCEPKTGVCNTPGCKAGWKGTNCSIQCENGTFGPSCKHQCYCLIGPCHNKNGNCGESGCIEGWKGETCSERVQQDDDSLSLTIGILVTVAFLILSAVLITIYIHRRRRRNVLRKNENNVQDINPNVGVDHVYDDLGSTENTELSQYSVIEVNNTEETTAYENISLDTTVLNIENIKDEVAENIMNGTIQKQHQTIPSGPLYPQTVGNLMKNRKKNRNQNILPYDHSMVVLEAIGHDEDTDYINASYINDGSDLYAAIKYLVPTLNIESPDPFRLLGLTEGKRYIATQGPMKNTLEDFWSMVWQTNCCVIVMLANITEKKQVICYQYWPVSSSALAFHDFEIVLLEEQTNTEFIARILRIRHTKTGDVRKIWHLQFTSWPNDGVPNPYQLLLLHRKYVEIHHSGIPIIHCSDGIDRTGVFIAFDALSEHCYRNEVINIFKIITEMRKHRMDMVKSMESYVLVNEMLVDHIRFQSNSFTKEILKAMPEKDARKEKEYEMLVDTLPEYSDAFYKEAMQKKNRIKNRNQSILPVETYRVILNSEGTTSYINAVTIPSCKLPKQFLVTQLPLENTVVDLWRMVNEYNACTIVSLEETPKFEKDLVWFPKDESKLILGNLTMTKTSETIQNMSTREYIFKISSKDDGSEKLVKLYQYLNWKPGSVTPKPQTSFLDLIHIVQTWNKPMNNGPITVICSDGAKCCGLFCLVYSIIENLSHSDDIDIYQMARLQQIRRPQFFTEEQYNFCYNIVQEYLEKSQIYKDTE